MPVPELTLPHFDTYIKTNKLIILIKGYFLKFFDCIELFSSKSTSITTSLFCFASSYWCCLSYGVITIFQVRIMMQKISPFFIHYRNPHHLPGLKSPLNFISRRLSLENNAGYSDILGFS